MKQNEDENEIVIAIIDETYDRDEDSYETESLKYVHSLREEFGEVFEKSNIGPGADIPAVVTVLKENLLPLLPWLLAAFFSGKPMVENIDAWRKILSTVQKYFSRPSVVNRNGAAVLAIGAIMEDLGGTPRSIKLKSYRPAAVWDVDDFEKLTGLDEIAGSPEIITLGMVFHLFEIEADTVNYLVGVNGTKVLIRRVQPLLR